MACACRSVVLPDPAQHDGGGGVQRGAPIIAKLRDLRHRIFV